MDTDNLYYADVSMDVIREGILLEAFASEPSLKTDSLECLE